MTYLKTTLAIAILVSSSTVQAGLFSGFKVFTHIGFLSHADDYRKYTHKRGNGHDRLPIYAMTNIPPGAIIGEPGEGLELPEDQPPAVPLPAAIWLFLSGIAGLILISRR